MIRASIGNAVLDIEEQHRLEPAGAGREQVGPGVQGPAQPAAERERRQDAGRRHRQGALEVAPHDVDAELHADDEHVERQPELRGGEQVALGVAGPLARIPREQLGLPFRCQPAEQRRAQQHAGDHLGDHLGLAEPVRDHADHSTGEQDDGDLQEEVNGELEIVHRTERADSLAVAVDRPTRRRRFGGRLSRRARPPARPRA
jgi:hypothetical protein